MVKIFVDCTSTMRYSNRRFIDTPLYDHLVNKSLVDKLKNFPEVRKRRTSVARDHSSSNWGKRFHCRVAGSIGAGSL